MTIKLFKTVREKKPATCQLPLSGEYQKSSFYKHCRQAKKKLETQVPFKLPRAA